MELPVIGVEKDREAKKPIVVPIAGYTISGNELVVTKIGFRPTLPLGQALDVIRQTKADGSVPVGVILAYLDACVLPDERDSWEAMLAAGDLAVEQATFIEVYKQLTAVYAGRPTMPPADSAGGSPGQNGTSSGGAGSRGSKSRKKASKPRSGSRTASSSTREGKG